MSGSAKSFSSVSESMGSHGGGPSGGSAGPSSGGSGSQSHDSTNDCTPGGLALFHFIGTGGSHHFDGSGEAPIAGDGMGHYNTQIGLDANPGEAPEKLIGASYTFTARGDGTFTITRYGLNYDYMSGPGAPAPVEISGEAYCLDGVFYALFTDTYTSAGGSVSCTVTVPA